MLVLAVDTSSPAVSAALVEASADAVQVRAEHQVINPRGHGEYLAPMIAACLGDVAPAELGALVAGTGPGPFTGLRVGLVTIAVMAETLGRPAYGVCSLDGISDEPNDLLVATDARRQEIYWARYRDRVRVDGPNVSRPADIATEGIAAMAGSGARQYADVLALPLVEGDYPRPAALVRRALHRIVNRAPADPLTPQYLRRPDAVEPAAPKTVSQ